MKQLKQEPWVKTVHCVAIAQPHEHYCTGRYFLLLQCSTSYPYLVVSKVGLFLASSFVPALWLWASENRPLYRPAYPDSAGGAEGEV